ncbi:MAG: hypothetical protein M1833_003830 [Piccolia ochrophora]|nr:MAG: hypothetical protein M1833_003830 [Piccolia ochrophora]
MTSHQPEDSEDRSDRGHGKGAHEILASRIRQTSPPSNAEEIYNIAVQKFLADFGQHEIRSDQLQMITSRSSVEALLQEVDNAKLRARKPRSRAMARISGWTKVCFSDVERFGGVVDVMIQSNPQVSALVWGSVRFLIVIARDVLDTFERLTLIVEKINECVSRFSEYMNLFGLGGILQDRLVNFYGSVIRFCVNAAKTYNRSKTNTLGAALRSSLKQPFDELVSVLDRHAEEVHKAAELESWKEHRKMQRSRKATLEAIRERLVGSNEQTHPRRAAIWGFPGVGKSSVVLKYASDMESTYDHVFLIRANIKAQMLSDYRMIASLLKLLEPYETGDKIEERLVIESVKAWFGNASSWLLILDNVNVNSLGSLREILPLTGAGHMLFTTRDQIAAQSLASATNTFEIKSFDIESSVELTCRLLEEPTPPRSLCATAEELCRAVGGLPIAIEQTVALARFRRVPLSCILRQLQKKKAELLNEGYATSMHEEQLPTGILLQMAADILAQENPQAMALFKILIFLDTSAIPLNLIKEGCLQLSNYLDRSRAYDRGSAAHCQRDAARTNEKPLQVTTCDRSPWREMIKMSNHWRYRSGSSASATADLAESAQDESLRELLSRDEDLRDVLAGGNRIENAILELRNAGLVRRNDHYTVSIHDLVRDLNLEILSGQDSLSHNVNAHCTMTILFLAFPIPCTTPLRIHDTCQLYLPHALSVLHHSKVFAFDTTVGPEVMHLTASTLKIISKEQSPERMLNSASWYYQAYNGYMRAWLRLRHLKPDIDIAKEAQEDNKRVGSLISRGPCTYERYGQAPQRALDAAWKLTQCLEYERQWDPAKLWAYVTYVGYTNLLGEAHPVTISAMVRFISITTASGDIGDALHLALHRIKLESRMDDEVGSIVAGCAAEISFLHERQGNWENALEWRERSLAGAKRMEGHDWQGIGRILTAKARVHRKLQQHGAAKDCSASAVDIRCNGSIKAVIDEVLLDAYYSLAISLEALGQPETAGTTWRETLQLISQYYPVYSKVWSSMIRPAILRCVWNICRTLDCETDDSLKWIDSKAIADAMTRYGPFPESKFEDDPGLILATDMDLMTSDNLYEQSPSDDFVAIN